MPMKKRFSIIWKALAYTLSVVVCVVLLAAVATGSGMAEAGSVTHMDVELMDRFDMSLTNRLSEAMGGMLAIDKVYWLSDDDIVAPEPDQSKYGSTTDPSTLDWLMEDAQDILKGQETVFHTGIQIARGTKVEYYLDDTIFAVTWKQGINHGMYTFSEIKIAHPSQFRRYLAGGEYGSGIKLKTSQMAATVNAVVASSGDFYAHRQHGVIVYDGTVQRINSRFVDTCYINERGDMVFTRAGELPDMESAQRFVEDNDIRFSLAFGPILIDHGKLEYRYNYIIGEIEGPYPRAALAQKDTLHYLLVTLNTEKQYGCNSDLYTFGKVIEGLGVEKAYTLDGGQTAVIAMNDRVINAVLYGNQRNISDIIYFATAKPDGG